MEQLYCLTWLIKGFQTSHKGFQGRTANESIKVLGIYTLTSPRDDSFPGAQIRVLSVKELDSLLDSQIWFLYLHHHPVLLEKLSGSQHMQSVLTIIILKLVDWLFTPIVDWHS